MSGQSTLSVSFGHMRVISFSFGDTSVKMQGSSNFAVLDIRALTCSSATTVTKSVVSRGAGRKDETIKTKVFQHGKPGATPHRL